MTFRAEPCRRRRGAWAWAPQSTLLGWSDGRLAGLLAGAADGVGLLAGFALRGLLVGFPLPHFTEDALALHLLLEHPERLIDIVVANKYLQRTCPLMRGANGSKGLSGINRCLWRVAGLDRVVPQDRSTVENPSLRPATPIHLFPDGP